MALLLDNPSPPPSPLKPEGDERSLEAIRAELCDGAGGLAAAARRILRWQAFLTWLTLLLVAMFVLMLGDMVLRREEFGLRLLATGIWILVAVRSAIELLLPAWRFSPSAVQVAQWIEEKRPAWGRQLSTAVELAQMPAADSRYGSSHFREAALRAWARRQSTLEWSQHLDWSGLRRACFYLLLTCSVLVALGSAWPAATRLALVRLTLPWSAYDWPHRDQLKFLHVPTVVAAGSELQLEIVDVRPPLPERIELQIREVAPGASPTVRTMQTIAIGDLAVGNLPPLNSSLEIRAVGGDDQRMAWHRIDVVQAPELTDFHFTVQPPSYTGLAQTEVAGNRITVLAGSQVEFRGRFDRPVARVSLQALVERSAQVTTAAEDLPVGGAASAAASTPLAPLATPPVTATQSPWVVTLDNDGLGLHLGATSDTMLDVQQSMQWQLRIVTADGLETLQPERWSIEVTADTPPRVVFNAADMPQLASNAQLRLLGEATDDLGLVSVIARLQVAGDDSTVPAIFPIWKMPENERSSSWEASSDGSIRELPIDTMWNIAQVASLVAGQSISVWLEACDSSGQWSQSQVQKFEIREPRELIESVQEKQNQLLTQVRELVDTQRRNGQLFSRTWEQSRQLENVQREQLDLFRNTAQIQRALAEQLDSATAKHGLMQEVVQLQELLERNRLDGTELAAELQVLADEIQTLSKKTMPEAIVTTTQTSLLAEQSMKDGDGIREELIASAQRAEAVQVTALRELEQLLDRLARNESLQQIQRELAQILNQQTAVRQETDRLQVRQLSEPLSQERTEQQAEKAALSADQQGLARRLDDWLARADELRRTTSSDQQGSEAALHRAVESLVAAQASDRMRRSTEEIRESQLARAAATQQQVENLLSETLRQLGAGNQSQLGSLRNRVDGLRQTGEELTQLADAQSALSQRWQSPNGDSARQDIMSEQSALEQRTRAAADRVEQAGDAASSHEIERATTAQQQAQTAGQQQNFSQAASASRQAAEQLKQTADRLQQRAIELEQQVAQQQMFQLAHAIEQLSAQQQPVTEQFSQWATRAVRQEGDTQRENASGSEKVEPAEMRRGAAEQEKVRQGLREVRAETSDLPTFDWTLEQAELSMGRAVAAAERYRIEPDAKEASATALRLLQLAADAMSQQRSNESTERSTDNNDEKASQKQSPDSESSPRPAPFVASLKLLRSLQQEINSKTLTAESMDESVRRTGRLSELANMQQALSLQLEQLLSEVQAKSVPTAAEKQ